MDLKITKQEKSALPRMEAEAIVKFEHMTPNRQVLKQEIAKKLKSNVELVIVRKIYNSYGDREAVIYAYVYDNADAMNSIENKKMVDKNVIKKEEKPAEEATPVEEEKPTEEKAEDSTKTAEPSKVEGE